MGIIRCSSCTLYIVLLWVYQFIQSYCESSWYSVTQQSELDDSTTLFTWIERCESPHFALWKVRVTTVWVLVYCLLLSCKMYGGPDWSVPCTLSAIDARPATHSEQKWARPLGLLLVLRNQGFTQHGLWTWQTEYQVLFFTRIQLICNCGVEHRYRGLFRASPCHLNGVQLLVFTIRFCCKQD